MYSERHFIIVPDSLQAHANAEAIKWDRDAGGSQTFNSRPLSGDGGASITHWSSSTLVDVGYIPPNQGGKAAPEVLNAFYATGFYVGYRITETNAHNQSLTSGLVETVALFPFRWVVVGTGRIRLIARNDQGLIKFDDMQ
jgi:hypothetical protein